MPKVRSLSQKPADVTLAKLRASGTRRFHTICSQHQQARHITSLPKSAVMTGDDGPRSYFDTDKYRQMWPIPGVNYFVSLIISDAD